MNADEKEPAEGPPAEEQDTKTEEQGPDASELDDDPAYNPKDPGYKGIKGG